MTEAFPAKPPHPRCILVVGFLLPSGGQLQKKMPQRAIAFRFLRYSLAGSA